MGSRGNKSRFDGLADACLPGSKLRNQAAGYLSAIYGNARVEQFVLEKKVDIVCDSFEFGKPTKIFAEAKDNARHLSRDQVASITREYDHLLSAHPAGKLLIVTRCGITPAASAFIDHQARIFHQTIWDLEDSAFALSPYLNSLVAAFETDGLDGYYVPAQANVVSEGDGAPLESKDRADLLNIVLSWLDSPDRPPLVILGGYGAGKTTFVRRLASFLANEALTNPSIRRPVLIKLGNMTRYASLDGLLGALFAGEFEIRGYSFNRFREFNRMGRLLVILDGFDEMKHAMTWTEFRNFMAEVNELVAGEAKIIILGRPAAFLSEGEYFELLRGVPKAVPSRQLFGLTAFEEIELAPFTDEERRHFIAGFVRYGELIRAKQIGLQRTEAQLDERARDINGLADQDPAIFRKPVHARMFAEIAIANTVDLSALRANTGRWELYRAFFSFLARRETSRPARSPIEEEDRNKFAHHLAWWLWTERQGSSAFAAADLPETVFVGLSSGDTKNAEELKREYLSGAPVESKAGETYYFAHRSFLEYLVADHILTLPTNSGTHRLLASAVRGGVADFLLEPVPRLKIRASIATLSEVRGVLSLEYLLFLAAIAGGTPALPKLLETQSPWRFLSEAIASLRGRDTAGRLATLVASATPEGVLLIISLLAQLRYKNERALRGGLGVREFFDSITPAIATALVDRTIGSVAEDDPTKPPSTSDERFVETLTIRAIWLGTLWSKRIISFSWWQAELASAELLERAGLGVASQAEPLPTNQEVDQVKVEYDALRNGLRTTSADTLDRISPRHGRLNALISRQR